MCLKKDGLVIIKEKNDNMKAELLITKEEITAGHVDQDLKNAFLSLFSILLDTINLQRYMVDRQAEDEKTISAISKLLQVQDKNINILVNTINSLHKKG